MPHVQLGTTARMVSDNQEDLQASKGDLMLASIFLGFFIGFGYYASYHTLIETRRARRFAPHVILCWGEIIACIAHALLSYLYLAGIMGPSLGLFFGIVTAWVVQVHCLLQIIVNRVGVLLLPLTKSYLKYSVAGLWTVICLSVYCVWIPAQLRISPSFENTNFYWGRVEKSIYFLTDATLNYYFIHTVKKRLIQHGLKKYDKLVRFNQCIVLVSLAADVLLVGLISLPSQLVYAQFHSVAFIIKLDIELSMSQSIVKIAQSTGIPGHDKLHITSIVLATAEERARTPSLMNAVIDIRSESTKPEKVKSWENKEQQFKEGAKADF